MRYVVVGAGSIGGAIGGRLHQHGHDVVLVARGAHLEAVARHGLVLADPDRSTRLEVPVVGDVGQADLSGAVVVLATKGQDTEEALRRLAAVAGPGTPVVCAQNGVENERSALRRFRAVYGAVVLLSASHLRAGEVLLHSAPVTGIVDVGRYPSGADDLAREIAADLRASTFDARADPDVMAAKWAKLVVNLGNALEALCGPGALASDLAEEARREARACLAAAGTRAAYPPGFDDRRAALTRLPAGGHPRAGSSTWMSLARGSGSVETDYLNGEIVRLGRRHGIPTPVNEVLQVEAAAAARDGRPAGQTPLDQLRAQVERTRHEEVGSGLSRRPGP